MYKSVLNSKTLKAVVGVFCAIALVFSAFFLPYEIKTKAENPWEIVIDFENGVGNYTGTSALTAVDMAGKNSAVSKVLKAGNFLGEQRNQLLKDEYLEVYTIPAGTYKVVYDYKVENYVSQSVRLMYNVNGNYLTGAPLTQNLIVDKTSSSEWRTGEVHFSIDKEVTNFGIGTISTGRDHQDPVYIDNIVITKLETDKGFVMDFEHDTADHTGSAMVKIVDGQDKDGEATKMLYASSPGEIRTQLIKDRYGATYFLSAGTYKMTYDYLVPENGDHELYFLYNVMVDYGVLDTAKTDYTSGRQLITENLLKDKTKGNNWVQGEITFTLEKDIFNIGFGLKKANKIAYIDNVVVSRVEPEKEGITIDFEEDTASYTTTSMVKIVDGEGKGGATTKMLYASSPGEIRTQLIKDKNGSTYSLPAGTYKMTYDYLVPENGEQELYILYNVLVDYSVLVNISNEKYTSGRKLCTANLIKDKTKGNTWVQGEITFTLDNVVNNIGFGAYTREKIVYLDNVVITPLTPGDDEDEDDNDQELDNYHSTPTLTVDFENHTEHDKSGVYAISNDPIGGTRGKNLGVVFNEWYRGGKQYVSIRNGVVSSCASGACSCASTQAVTLPAGEYKVTYDYYYTDADYDEAYLHSEEFSFKFAFSNSADALALTDTTFGDEIVDKNKDKDIWNKGSMTVELADGFKHFGFSVQHSPYHIYIDNIKFYQKIAEEVTVTFETNGGSAVAPVTGYEKTAITVANPTKEGFEFTGWYEDAACTIPSDMKFKVGVTKLYAAWSQTDGSIRFDFDEYNAGFKSGNPFSGGMYAVTNDPIAQNGKTLGVNTNFGGDCHAVNRQILFNNGTQKTTLPAGIYKIDYKYYTRYASPSEYSAGSKTKLENAYNRIENATLAFGVVGANFNTTITNSMAAHTENLFDLTQVTEGYQGQWTNGSVLIHITDAMVTAGNNNLVLSAAGVPFPVYIDDIRIYEAQLSDVTISFDSKGGSKVNKINTKSFLPVTLPTPTRNGYEFLGWFDVNGNPAKTTAPEINITYYAKWQEVGEHYLIDMDNGFLTGSTTVYGSAYFTVNSDKFAADAQHKNTLQYKFNNIGSILPRIHLLSSNNKVAKIKAETAYKVTFEYYVESLPTAPGVTFDFTTKHINGHAYEPSGTVRLTGGNILNEITPKSTELVGKWIKKTVVFISPKEIGSATLGLYCSGDTGIAIYLDNIEISAMGSDDVVLNYVIPATGQTSTLIGKKGQTIDKSQIAPFASNYYDFAGWYLDADFITPHTSAKFPSKHTTIYGKTQLTKNGVHVNFDDYPWPKNTPGKTNPYVQAEKTGISHDGDGWVLKVDNTGNEEASVGWGFMLNAGADTLNINENSSYAITYSIYVKEPGNPGNFNYRFMQCSPTMNYPENMYDRYESINLNDYKGKWITRSIICNSGPSKADVLSIRFNCATPKNTIFYIDDIIVREIPEGYGAVLYSSDFGAAPNLVVVPQGTTIQLGKPKDYPSEYQFAGWNDGVILITDSTYIVTQSIRLVANFASNFVEDFEDFRSDGYTHKYDSYDDDWEIYDSKANGNSSDNVKSGRYSLHSLGKDPNFKAHSIFMNSKFSKNELVFNGMYTISMWVKTEAKPVHKLGAIEIGNNTTKINSWSLITDRFAVAPIAEIADGQWHKISYTFTSLSRYLSIYVPGNIELFIDDIEVKFTPDSVSSSPKLFEAYVPTLLSTDGTYVKPNADKDTLNDFELVKRTETVTQGGSQLITLITQNIGATIAIIAGAVVLLAGIAVGTIVFIKKRKAKGVK